MEMIRPKGNSYTVLSAEGRMERALRRDRDRVAPRAEYSGDPDVPAARLAGYFRDDFELVIRQLISALDKVIRKPRGNSLRNFHIDAYVDRTRLAMELWRRFDDEHGEAVRSSPGGLAALAQLAAMWRWKVHPYCKEPADQLSPRSDKNAEVIAKHGDKEVERTAFAGRWHGALWKTNSSGKADYHATASAIWTHLFENELKIAAHELDPLKQHRNLKIMPQPPDRGLAQAKGRSIAHAARDPATGPKHRLRVRTDGEKIGDEIFAEYFRSDVSTKIRALVLDSAMNAGGTNAKFSHTEFGRVLYEHFGPIIKRGDLEESRRDALWDLHHAVRGFYQDLGRSERFRRAMRDPAREREKLEDIMPRDCAHLLRILEAKDRNGDISALTRLGKLIAHASDLRSKEGDPSSAFAARLSLLQTSEGQNEIKRNEAFTRVWRTSVALSLRTLRGLMPPSVAQKYDSDVDRDGVEDKGIEDPADLRYAKATMKSFDASRYRSRIGLLLGSKPISALEGRARSSLFLASAAGSAASESEKQFLWALFRVAGEIRHRTNHFNTKDRLIGLLQSCPLKGERAPAHFESRRSNVVHQDALDVFQRLLDFDIKLRREVIIEDFRRLNANKFVRVDELQALFGELAKVPEAIDLAPPKFINVLRRAKNLANNEGPQPPTWIAPFGVLDLKGLSEQTEGVNHFRIGILRLLYASGFAAWLAERLDDGAFIQDKIAEVNAAKKERFEAYFKGDQSDARIYAFAETLADRIGLEDVPTLRDLLHKLQAEATNEDAIRPTYRVNAAKQKDAMTAVREFRLDLFARLFSAYLTDMDLSFVWTGEGELPAADRVFDDVLSQLEPPPSPIAKIAPWHCQFYAWLYLVPVDDVALLRHQFAKTHALETKAGATPPEALTELDRLMGLYLAVNAAGFGGREHVDGGLDVAWLFYQRPQDSKIADEVFEKDQPSLPGTLRGLRQILRMDHHDALRKIFEKHQVTSDEVRECARLREGDVHDWHKRKATLNEFISAMVKQRAVDERELAAACGEYRNVATQLALHSFRIAGARLTEFARLHQLMMRILARLADFCLMWERDRQYVFLGLLCRQIGFDRLSVTQQEDGTIGLILPDELHTNLARIAQRKTRSSEQQGLPTPEQAAEGFLPLWHPRYGFVRAGRGADLTLLPDDGQDVFFTRHFGQSDEENPLDVTRREARARMGHKEPPRARTSFADGKVRIRNDFAHFNIIATGSRLNLTYLTNAVRSLMAHDRKMKNAVSKAVADIVAEAGLELRWSMSDDRLQHPEVVPLLETHLGMVRQHELRFHVPHASVRFTSMVKAMFDFGNSGYRDAIPINGKREQKGPLRYPEAFSRRLDGDKLDVPDEIRELVLPSLDQKRPND